MAFIDWSEKLETGISKIDLQHRILVSMINTIAEAIDQKDSAVRDFVIEVNIGQLLEYTQFHFRTEEELFLECKYPDYESHKKTHDDFAATAQNFYKRFAKGENIHEELLEILKSWLTHHIMGDDMKYVPLIKHLKPDL